MRVFSGRYYSYGGVLNKFIASNKHSLRLDNVNTTEKFYSFTILLYNSLPNIKNECSMG